MSGTILDLIAGILLVVGGTVTILALCWPKRSARPAACVVGHRLVVCYGGKVDVQSLAGTQEAAQVARSSRAGAAASRAGKGAPAGRPEYVIFLSPRFCPKGYRIAWFQPVGAAAVGVDRDKLPLQLLVATQLHPHGHDRYRILAAVYDLDAHPVVSRTVDPATGDDTKLDPAAVKLPPEVDDAEHRAQRGDREGDGIHAPDSTPADCSGQDRSGEPLTLPTVTIHRRTFALALLNAFGAGFLTAILLVILIML
ncbi:hypothetical protein OPIT5_29445 [Opitutaceae bacterium TAV5]|nr:hypothetical protein OPIT5_29445 [Opitutaceae bacterium TAV5]